MTKSRQKTGVRIRSNRSTSPKPRTDDAEKLKTIPIWSFHGDADRVVPVSKSQEMVDAIKQVGGEKVQLTIYPGVNHNSWTPAYANPNLYDWLLSYQRAK